MFGEFKDAFRKYNNGLAQLIIINVIVFILLAVNYVFVQELFGLPALATLIHNQFSIPPTFGEFVYRPWTLLTYAFAHSLTDILHIIMNMLMLYWFGRIFVEYLGSDKLISLYILGALTGAFFYLLMFNTVPYFIERASVIAGMVGASAAVYAIVVGTATLLPDYTLFLLFFGPVKIKYIAAISIMISFIGTVGMNAGGFHRHQIAAHVLEGFDRIGVHPGGHLHRLTRLRHRHPPVVRRAVGLVRGFGRSIAPSRNGQGKQGYKG